MSENQLTEDQPSEEMNELQLLVDRAHQGDAAVLPALREAMDAHPEVWCQMADLAKHTQYSWIRLLASTDLFCQELLTRWTAELRQELTGESPTSLEKLLIDRVVARARRNS